MVAYWDTDGAKAKSTTASKCRNSDRGGLGPHKHVGGPRSFDEIEQDMVTELGRPVSVGEVFLRTHTRKDGSFVDEKARLVGEKYDINMQARLSQLPPDSSMASDGTSRPPRLTLEEMNSIFIESTMQDDRGNPYGLGSLSRRHGKDSESWSSSETVLALKDQLAAAQKKIEEQEAENLRRDEADKKRDAKLARQERENRASKRKVTLLETYLMGRDPGLAQWLESQAPEEPSSEPSTNPPENVNDDEDEDVGDGSSGESSSSGESDSEPET